MDIEAIKDLIRDVPDFPQPGIVFKDITPVLADPLACSTIIDLIVVVIFTKPLVTLLVNSRMFGSQRPWTGLSPDRLGVTAVRAEPERRPRRVPRTGEV